VDDAETNKKFAQSLAADYPLLSDPTKQVAKAYGVDARQYAPLAALPVRGVDDETVLRLKLRSRIRAIEHVHRADGFIAGLDMDFFVWLKQRAIVRFVVDHLRS